MREASGNVVATQAYLPYGAFPSTVGGAFVASGGQAFDMYGNVLP